MAAGTPRPIECRQTLPTPYFLCLERLGRPSPTLVRAVHLTWAQMPTLESVVRPRPFLLSTCDRRIHGRAPLMLPVLIDTQRDWLRASSVDVSASGLAVGSVIPASVGALVELYFELPCGIAIEAKAKVVRVATDCTGLQFVDLARDAMVAIRAHCRMSVARA